MPALLLRLALALPALVSPGLPVAQDAKPAGAVAIDKAKVAPHALKLNAAAANVQVKNVAMVKKSAAQLSVKSFERKESLADYRQATASLDRAAQTLQQKAGTMSRQDFIIADARLTVASRRAEQINARAVKGERISNEEVAHLTSVTAPTETYAARMTMGEPPVPRQTVTVRVFDPNRNVDVQNMKVYALPKDYMDYPEQFSPEMFKTAIDEFSFEEETSPTSKNLPASSVNLWIGPRMKNLEMAALAKQRLVRRYRPVNVGGGANDALLQFIAPDDIVQP